MEQEFKWKSSSFYEEDFIKFIKNITFNDNINMSATYYDTKDNFLSSKKAGLRIRQENKKSICCLKISKNNEDGFFQRLEFEVCSYNIQKGLLLLKENPEITSLCEKLLTCEMIKTCEINFMRSAYLISEPTFKAELCFDNGFFNKKIPFSEIEMELKDGSESDFIKFAESFQNNFALIPEPLSKLARGLTGNNA